MTAPTNPPPEPAQKRPLDHRKDAASRIAERQKKAKAEKIEAQAVLEDDDFFVSCKVCAMPGIYIERYPESGEIPWDAWWSTYKGKDEPHFGEQVACQCCGQVLPLTKSTRNGSILIATNHLRYVDSDKRREKRVQASARQLEEFELKKAVKSIQVTTHR